MRAIVLLTAVALALGVLPLRAQQNEASAKPLTVDDVLAQVQQIYNVYLRTVPDLLADEHIVSSVSGTGAHEKKIKSDSIFRLKRTMTRDRSTELQESREPKSKKDAAQQLDGPSMISGVFSYAPMDLSLELRACYDYRLGSDRRVYNTAVLVVEYTLKARLPSDVKCPVTEPVSGRAFIDPSTMQILRMEQRLPQHDLYGGIQGLWSWSIDYAPVTLEGRQLWLPRTISSESTARRQDVQWTFVSTYSNYHLLTVHSKVLPLDSASPAQ